LATYRRWNRCGRRTLAARNAQVIINSVLHITKRLVLGCSAFNQLADG
jgi:hypothetical protein